MIDDVHDKLHEYQRDHVGDAEVFVDPDTYHELRDQTVTLSGETVAGHDVTIDENITGVAVYPPSIDDLHGEEAFMDSPPRKFTRELMRRLGVTEEGGIYSVTVYFELLRETVEIGDEYLHNARCSDYPAPMDVDHEPGERLIGMPIKMFVGPQDDRVPQYDPNHVTDSMALEAERKIGETVEETVTGLKKYVIRFSTGLEKIQWEQIDVGVRRYELGRLYMAPVDLSHEGRFVDMESWK